MNRSEGHTRLEDVTISLEVAGSLVGSGVKSVECIGVEVELADQKNPSAKTRK